MMITFFSVSIIQSSFFFKRYGDHRDLHSFPTRRSSDLSEISATLKMISKMGLCPGSRGGLNSSTSFSKDRKSTCLNSSHVEISYAVFCLKKKKKLEKKKTRHYNISNSFAINHIYNVNIY